MSNQNKHSTISEVVKILKNEFEDISISKIRYLEDEGVIQLKRTKGGYRIFADLDIEKLRMILKMQTEQYLPLNVIKEKLRDLKDGSKDDIGAESKLNLVEIDEDSEEEDQEILTEAELSKMSGLSEDGVEDLIKYGLISGNKDSEGLFFSSDDLAIAKFAKEFERWGVEPRHLRMFEAHAEKKGNIYYQIIAPSFRQKGKDAKKKIGETLNELQDLSAKLEKKLLEKNIKKLIK